MAVTVTTYTCTSFSNPAQAIHTGANYRHGKMTHGPGTVGDILFLAKVPHGARIVDMLEHHSNGETAAAYSFGFDRGIAAGGGGNASCLIASGVLATNNRLSLAGGLIRISLSDADPVRYAVFQAKAESGTFTITSSLSWILTYHMDGQDLP